MEIREISISIMLLIIGFAGLVKGGDFFVDGASSLAARFSVSEVMIGLTVVAFGTSAPEMVVNIIASLKEKDDIVFGNIIGSNISNTLLILGIAGLIYPVKVEKNTIWKEIPFSLVGVLVLFVMVNDRYFNPDLPTMLTGGDGIILLFFFVIFIVYTFGIPKVEVTDSPEISDLSTTKIMIYLVLGLIGLLVGGKLVVESAVMIARSFSVSEKFIGLTIISIGTSLPELFTVAMAAYKKKSDLVIGSIVGSNIFNLFFVLGCSSLVKSLSFDLLLNIDILVLIGASVFLFITMFTGVKRVLDRWEAFILVISYLGYLIFLIIRR